jgi:thioredoxin-dependent peroxiredoxin
MRVLDLKSKHMVRAISGIIVLILCAVTSTLSYAAAPEVGKPAPNFTLKNQEGKDFKLESRKGKGYTVLFFYPMAGTPGCTKQACAFRDSIKVIRDQGAEVYGISADSVAEEKKFHDEHKMTFDLLSDKEAKVIELFGVKMPVVTMAKRQTFILDEKLIVRKHFEDVDPTIDAKNVAAALTELKAGAPKKDDAKPPIAADKGPKASNAPAKPVTPETKK